MFCTSCGAPLEDNAKFCTSCGARVENATAPATPAPAPAAPVNASAAPAAIPANPAPAAPTPLAAAPSPAPATPAADASAPSAAAAAATRMKAGVAELLKTGDNLKRIGAAAALWGFGLIIACLAWLFIVVVYHPEGISLPVIFAYILLFAGFAGVVVGAIGYVASSIVARQAIR